MQHGKAALALRHLTQRLQTLRVLLQPARALADKQDDGIGAGHQLRPIAPGAERLDDVHLDSLDPF